MIIKLFLIYEEEVLITDYSDLFVCQNIKRMLLEEQPAACIKIKYMDHPVKLHSEKKQ